MEIYRLKDEVPEARKKWRSKSDGAVISDGLKITDLKAGVKNPNRVNVYVDGDYAFSLDVAQVVDLGVKVGRVLSDAEMAEMRELLGEDASVDSVSSQSAADVAVSASDSVGLAEISEE